MYRQKTRANKWAATALLARCYLYQKEWQKAEIEASKIIDQISVFKLATDLNVVFEKNNEEAILQWYRNTKINPYAATFEGVLLNPAFNPSFYLSDQLLGSFEDLDERKTKWIKSIVFDGKTYEYPNKYKKGPFDSNVPNAPATEYYTILRLAEQFLIRAEARAQINNLIGAIDDINVIRRRAGLLPLDYNLTKAQVLLAIMHERKIEFFVEWGHRWLDLKRTDKADEVMAVISPLKNGGIAWQAFKKLWPIPESERTKNPFLTQNSGY